jgi:hypothetical protein
MSAPVRSGEQRELGDRTIRQFPPDEFVEPEPEGSEQVRSEPMAAVNLVPRDDRSGSIEGFGGAAASDRVHSCVVATVRDEHGTTHRRSEIDVIVISKVASENSDGVRPRLKRRHKK